MKKFLLLLVFCGLMACSDDDTNTPANTTIFNGSWNMDTYVAFMAEPPQLEPGDVTWNINGNTVTVINTVQEQYPYMLASGTYTLTTAGDVVTVHNHDYEYTLNTAELNIVSTQASVDGGPAISFSKN